MPLLSLSVMKVFYVIAQSRPTISLHLYVRSRFGASFAALSDTQRQYIFIHTFFIIIKRVMCLCSEIDVVRHLQGVVGGE